MIGTIINIITVLIGGLLGLFWGAHLPDRLRQTIIAGLGLFTAMIGIQMFLKTGNPIIVLISLLCGGVLGEWWKIEDRLISFGAFLEKRFTSPEPVDVSTPPSPAATNRFIQGFLTASLVFCIGPMTILGSIQDGLTGNYQLLAIKSVLDGFAALAFASTMGVGVLFSIIVILIYQGGISLLASQLQALISQPMMYEMTAVGGLMLLGLAISSLLQLKTIRVGNFLPALVIAPAIVAILEILKITY